MAPLNLYLSLSTALTPKTLEMGQSSNLNFVVECKFMKNPCSMTAFICTESGRAQTNLYFFSNSIYHTNYSYRMCNIIFRSVMCYTVLIRTLILQTLGNNILLQLFN